jgi:mRNA interferase RelE/StbE
MDASYRVRLHPDARSDLASLDKGLQQRAGRQLGKLEGHPHAGEPLGHKAGYDLTGYRSLPFAGKRYRIVYRLDEEAKVVWVIAIGKKAKFEAYRLAAWRADGEE